MKTKIAFCAVMTCLVSSFAAAQEVAVNYNHNASFAQYHT